MDLLDPKLDVVFKMLFASEKNRDVLCAFLTAVLAPAEPIVYVDVLNPELPRSGADEKGFVLDLRVRLRSGAHICVEMQNVWHDAFFERVLGYLSRLKSAQLSPGELYTKSVPTIAILVLDFVPRFASPASARFHRIFEPRDGEDGVLLTTSMPIHVLTLPYARGACVADEDEPVLRWGRFFNAAPDAAALERLAMQDRDIAQAKEALEALSQDKEARFEAETRRINKLYFDHMVRSAQEEAAAKGHAEGHAEGRAEGLSKGHAEGLLAGEAHMLARVLEKKLGPLDERARTRVATATSEQLETYMTRLFDARTLEDVFDDD